MIQIQQIQELPPFLPIRHNLLPSMHNLHLLIQIHTVPQLDQILLHKNNRVVITVAEISHPLHVYEDALLGLLAEHDEEFLEGGDEHEVVLGGGLGDLGGELLEFGDEGLGGFLLSADLLEEDAEELAGELLVVGGELEERVDDVTTGDLDVGELTDLVFSEEWGFLSLLV